MDNKINCIVDKFIIRVTNLFGERIKKIILYGSYARGDFKKFRY